MIRLVARLSQRLPLIGAFAALAFAVMRFGPAGEPTVLFEQESPYGLVQVLEQPDGLRELYLTPGGARQTALYPGRPLDLVLDYTRVAQVGLALVPLDARLLYVGLGGGAMPMYARRMRPMARISAVDIDPVVVRVAQEWFGFEPDWGMRAYVGDGAEFIGRVSSARWHMIALDAFSIDGVPEALSTPEFFEDVRRVLRPDGVVVANVHTGNPAYEPMMRAYRATFEQVVELQVPGRAQRIVLAAGTADPAPLLQRESVLEAVRHLAADRDPGFDLERLIERAWR